MSLISWYKLDGNVIDSCGKANGVATNLTYTGGKIGQCGNFSNSYITIGTGNTFLPLRFFSISAWVKTPGLGNGMSANGVLSITYGMVLVLGSSGAIGTRLDDGSSLVDKSYAASLNDNIFHHLVWTYDGIYQNMYLDGAFLGRYASTWSGITRWMTNDAVIGQDNNNGSVYRFNGLIDDVRIYDHALSAREVKELSQAKVLHYKFDDFQEYTQNIWPNGDISSTGTTGWNANQNVTLSTLSAYERTYIHVVSNQATSTPGILSNAFAVSPSTTYTISLKGYKGSTGNCYLYVWGNSSGNLVWNGQALTTTPKTLYNTFTTGASDTQIRVGVLWSGVAINDWFDINDIQVEAKDHYTPFVNGSRSGVILDSSGYENHATLTSSTPRWVSDAKVGEGCYRFNGSNSLVTNKLFYSDTVQSWTVSAWVYLEDNTVYNQYLNNFNLGNQIVYSGSNGKALLYINDDTYDAYAYSDGAMVTSQWFHLCFVMNTNTLRCQIYLNGSVYGNTANYTVGDVPDGFDATTIFGTNFKGRLDDVRVYATDLSTADIQELYSGRYSLTEKGILKSYKFVETKYKPLTLNYTTWVIGTSGSQTGFTQNGETACNSIIEGPDPFGNSTAIWRTLNNDVGSDADGGWDGSSFAIDNTKLYRFSVWVKRRVLGNGTFYFGCHGFGTTNGVYYNTDGTTLDTNPYFTARAWSGLPMDEWVLVVGHIWPYTNTSTSNHVDSGYYNTAGVKIANISRDFRWHSASTSSNHRTYLYYSTDATTDQEWCYPRVDLCDGTEPSISDLLSGIDSNILKYYSDSPTVKNIVELRDNGCLIAPEISECGITDGLVGWWPLNGNAMDYTEYARDGVVTGATITQGQWQSAYKFSSGSTYIDLADDLGYTTAFSACAWFRSLGTPGDGYHIVFGGSYLEMSISTAGALRTGFFVDGTRYVHNYGSGVTDGNWHHVMFTFDGTNKVVYLDGAQVGSDVIPAGTLTSSFSYRRIGVFGTSTNYYTNGLIQDARIYNRALSAAEVKILYDITGIKTMMLISDSNEIYIKGISEI